MKYSDEKIEEVLEASDIVSLISPYVNLKRAGVNYKGLCPFHHEKTPSFMVNPQKKIFHCFGCGAGGNSLKFLMLINGQSFPEALKELALKTGVDLGTLDSYNINNKTSDKASMYEALKEAQKFYEKMLWSSAGTQTREYLQQRGIQPQTIKEYSLGLSGHEWSSLYNFLKKSGFDKDILLNAGLAKESSKKPGNFYDFFRQRLIVPIFDQEGRTVAFGGRILGEGQPKYLNSPETPVYKKNKILFGYQKARPFLRASGLGFLVEGYFDQIALYQAGVKETIATLGTALTMGHLNFLRGQVNELILLFDSDEAGQKAAERALPLLLNAEIDGRVIKLPSGFDPDTFIREYGSEALYEMAANSIDILEFYVQRLKTIYPKTLAGQAKMARSAQEILAQVPDSIKSQLLRNKLAELLSINPNMLNENIAKSLPVSESLKQSNNLTSASKLESVDQLTIHFLKHIIIHPESAHKYLIEMESYWPQDSTLELYNILKSQVMEYGKIKADEIPNIYNGELLPIVTEALLSSREFTPERAEEATNSYKEKIKQRWLKLKHQEISQLIKKAQQENDHEKLLTLLQEKNSLHKN